MPKRIKKNEIMCNNCGEIIESTHRHDYRACSCGDVAVDGGKDYLRRTFKTGATYTELSEEVEVEE